jgi:hypothetical protein
MIIKSGEKNSLKEHIQFTGRKEVTEFFNDCEHEICGRLNWVLSEVNIPITMSTRGREEKHLHFRNYLLKYNYLIDDNKHTMSFYLFLKDTFELEWTFLHH